jgi:hypothetical protein
VLLALDGGSDARIQRGISPNSSQSELSRAEGDAQWTARRSAPGHAIATPVAAVGSKQRSGIETSAWLKPRTSASVASTAQAVLGLCCTE